DLDIDCQFVQGEGARNNAGGYEIRDWGAVDPRWIERELARIKTVLGYP
ncbi:helix-turn-helix domain-containing protein, partial [uncultured Pseudomonas sp.]